MMNFFHFIFFLDKNNNLIEYTTLRRVVNQTESTTLDLTIIYQN